MNKCLAFVVPLCCSLASNPGVAQVGVAEKQVHSQVLGRDRKVWVYTPPAYDAKGAVRRFRDVLRSKGYSVTYTEVPGGVHAPDTWVKRLPVGLEALAGS